jgi:hypothetical protein
MPSSAVAGGELSDDAIAIIDAVLTCRSSPRRRGRGQAAERLEIWP